MNDEQWKAEAERKVKSLESDVSDLKRTIASMKMVVDMLQFRARQQGWQGL